MKIMLEFDPPVDWDFFKNANLNDCILVSYGSSYKIHACRVSRENLDKIAGFLNKKKVAFKINE